LHAGSPVPAIEVDGCYYDLQVLAPHLLENSYGTGLMALFKDWATSEAELLRISSQLSPSDDALRPIAGSESFMTPLQYPRKLILGGANYYEHMHKDAGKPDFKKEDGMPVFFLKPPTTTLVGCGKVVVYPAHSNKFDWEIELAVVVGRHLRNASEEDALAAVAAYTVGLDLSARDWQMNERHPWKFDLFTGKAFNTSCPVGPKLVPASFVDPKNLTLAVNGVVKQDARTSDMIWNIGEQISLLSKHVTLKPGDILLTGTPAGVGLATGEYLSINDTITAKIEGLGALQVEVVDGQAAEAKRS
jgi:2-keto-4-pentenoate hydratase/2-oxohepta-3-ene-1,7-dioic acid hydratase in catechol pathway